MPSSKQRRLPKYSRRVPKYSPVQIGVNRAIVRRRGGAK